MSENSFYLLFIPGLTVAAVVIGFTFSVFALNQGEFQTATRKGLLSLVLVSLLAAVLGVLAVRLDHVNLPPGAR
jgi:glycerol-3-phosphate acyltransferase PlsY